MTEPNAIPSPRACPLDMANCPAHTHIGSFTFEITPEHMPMIRLLLGRHTADTITDDALDALYRDLDETRQQLALSQAGASQRVRDYATGLKDGTVSHGLTADGCADRILAALDAEPREQA